MKTIWKYYLDIKSHQIMAMKRGAQILDVQVQEGNPCIWALVDPLQPSEEHMFRIYGTGHPVTDKPGRYIGTFQLHDGSLVFHLFETTP